jgi:GWxTD domain-containing protein
MHRTVAAMVVLILSSTVSAQLSEEHENYFDGPEGFLMTKMERKAWKNISNDDEAEAFIDLFWAKRDPDLSTSINELRVDFNQRVEAADELFGHGATRGALSDRGRVLILLGRFSRMDNRPPGAVASGVELSDESSGFRGAGPATGGAYQNEGSTEIWEYDGKNLPVRVGQSFVYAVFRETKVDMNDYILDRTNGTLMRVLSKAPDTLIANPSLTEVPRVGLIPGSRPAAAAELKWFEMDPRPWPGKAAVIGIAGLVPGPRHYLWLHTRMPEDGTAATSMAGRLREANSAREIGTFVVDLEEIAIGDDAYELSIPVNEGSWRLDIAFAGDAGPVAVTTVEVETAVVQPAGTTISPFCWGTDVRQEPKSAFGDPFNIGGWRLVPLVENSFLPTTPESLNYMAYVLDPELGPDGLPQFEVTVALYKDGARVAKTPSQSAPLSKLTDGVWMFGSGLPLARFTRPGAYRLEVELVQTSDGVKGVAIIPFEMVEGSATDGS